MRVKIEITKQDIRTGVRRNCNRCPVALAIRRKLRAGLSVTAVDAFAFFKERGIDLDATVYFPAKVANFIHAFDDLKRGESRTKLKPFSFTANIPKEYLCV